MAVLTLMATLPRPAWLVWLVQFDHRSGTSASQSVFFPEFKVPGFDGCELQEIFCKVLVAPPFMLAVFALFRVSMCWTLSSQDRLWWLGLVMSCNMTSVFWVLNWRPNDWYRVEIVLRAACWPWSLPAPSLRWREAKSHNMFPQTALSPLFL